MNSQTRLEKFLDPGRSERRRKARAALQAQHAKKEQEWIDEYDWESELPEDPPEPRPKSQFEQLAELLGEQV
jgi:hypothetical protein